MYTRLSDIYNGKQYVINYEFDFDIRVIPSIALVLSVETMIN
jgi:hypothetical protein